VLALGAVIVTTACAGSNPASPSSALTAGVSSSAAVTEAKAESGSGMGSLVLGPVSDGQGGTGFGFADGTLNGQTGRVVHLSGDIDGTNFEAGVCHPGVDANGLHCVAFGDGPGQFTREAPGGVAFTTCECTIAGRTGVVTLKISYPPAVNGKYPGGFTKFTFQHPEGGLQGLAGQGTLDFAQTQQISFSYHFTH
jgi:hypothetical protein